MKIVFSADRLAKWSRGRPFAVDTMLVGGLVLIVLAKAERLGGTPTQLLVQLALLVPLAWRRTAPVPAAAAVAAVGLLEVVLTDEFPVANVSALVMVHALAAYGGRRAGRAGLGLGLVASALAACQLYWRYDDVRSMALAGGVIAVTVVAAWALGDLCRARLQEVADLGERARLLGMRREQEMRLAAGEERARIAREMHDVVAHSLSVVIAQADGGRYAGRTDPAAATAALAAVGEIGRAALTDMRALLGVLREGHDAMFAPQPNVAAIGSLVQDVRASGLEVDLRVEGAEKPLPDGSQLAAYRIVQESLTNVLKHAGPGGRAWVRLSWLSDALRVCVFDDGCGAVAAADDCGQGVRGMQERARLHGGRLDAGPRAEGGFQVTGKLPYRGPS